MRKVLFWLHLSVGVVAALLIFVMCVTGVLLTFERQMLDWFDRRDARVVVTAGAARLPLADLISKSGQKPIGIVVRSDPAEPVQLILNQNRSVYLNPYTAAATGQPSAGAHEFFEATRAWHRWIAMGDAAKKRTAPLYDAANVLFLFIVFSGPFLWWPKKWTWQHLRPITWFRRRLSGKARDFNWHNTIGLWTSIPMAIIVASGIVLSYKWANDLIYRATGTEFPKQVKAEPLPKGTPATWQGVDTWVARGQERVPDWRTITIRNAPTKTLGVVVDAGTGGQPQKRGTLTVDRLTGAEVRWEPFGNFNLGYKIRILARVFHTGEVGGAAVQAFAGLVSLGGAFLVYTGIALSLRRYAAWRRRKARSKTQAAVEVTV